MKKSHTAKDHYRQLRLLSCERLWEVEVPAFDRADPAERLRDVAVVRAVGVVFAESGSPDQRQEAARWLKALLGDPSEKVRRYAMAALPKLGGDAGGEAELLALLQSTSSPTEKISLGRTLAKIGGAATLRGSAPALLDASALRKVEVNVVRSEQPGAVALDHTLTDHSGLRIHLHCREGLERFVADEFDEFVAGGAPFRRVTVTSGRVEIAARGPFTLGSLLGLRCHGRVGFEPHRAARTGDEEKDIAAAIASAASTRLMQGFTDGPPRYRLEFVSEGHRRAAIRRIADRVHALRPELLNDARMATWQVNIARDDRGWALEITPRLRPDPRFAWRVGDVPAASHPPLAACLARLAGTAADEVVWDPFCGSGLELIERSLRGGVAGMIGTDLSQAALDIAAQNLTAALGPHATTLWCGDFRDFHAVPGLGPNTVSLIITNPPLGRRVPVPNLPGLIAALFETAATVLRPGGRLVFVNPVSVKPRSSVLRLDFRGRVDLGGFHCHLERYTKAAAASSGGWTGSLRSAADTADRRETGWPEARAKRPTVGPRRKGEPRIG